MVKKYKTAQDECVHKSIEFIICDNGYGCAGCGAFVSASEMGGSKNQLTSTKVLFTTILHGKAIQKAKEDSDPESWLKPNNLLITQHWAQGMKKSKVKKKVKHLGKTIKVKKPFWPVPSSKLDKMLYKGVVDKVGKKPSVVPGSTLMHDLPSSLFNAIMNKLKTDATLMVSGLGLPAISAMVLAVKIVELQLDMIKDQAITVEHITSPTFMGLTQQQTGVAEKIAKMLLKAVKDTNTITVANANMVSKEPFTITTSSATSGTTKWVTSLKDIVPGENDNE